MTYRDGSYLTIKWIHKDLDKRSTLRNVIPPTRITTPIAPLGEKSKKIIQIPAIDKNIKAVIMYEINIAP